MLEQISSLWFLEGTCSVALHLLVVERGKWASVFWPSSLTCSEAADEGRVDYESIRRNSSLRASFTQRCLVLVM